MQGEWRRSALSVCRPVLVMQLPVDDQFALDTDSCILCCACIKGCPEEALSIKATLMLEKKQWLHENCVTRKEPEFYW